MKRFAYIDALRGYAILMVIAVHSSLYFTDLPPTVFTFASQGARGVQLFFVTSALALCLSWQSRNDGAGPFYIRRIFRIAPMFWLAMVSFIGLQGLGPRYFAPDGIGLRQILMAATFLHGLMPDTISSVVPGSWSVADEMIFYAVFPILFFAVVGLRFPLAIILTALTTFICVRLGHGVALRLGQIPDATTRTLYLEFFGLWFPAQFPCFLFGLLVFKASSSLPCLSNRRARLLTLLAITLTLSLPFLLTIRIISYFGPPITFAAAFALCAFGLMHWQPKFLVNRFIGWIGKVSYSAYFWHFGIVMFMPAIRVFASPTIDFLATYIFVVGVTIAASTITYTLIERPMTSLGNRLLNLLPSKQSASSEDGIEHREHISALASVRISAHNSKVA